MKDGKADFALLDSTSVIANLDRFPDLKVAFQLPDIQHYGFAVPPESDLLQALDAHLKSIQAGGQLHSMIRHVLGDKGAKMLELMETPK